jgi:hypothetical protein
VSQRLQLRTGAVEWREVEGEVIAVDTRTATYLAVNRSGAVLWPALVHGAEREELVDALTREFEIDRPQAGSDVDAFIELLAEKELLEP